MPKITVVIATQNRRKSLDRAVQSVLCQSFLDWELYIVNDSSSIIESYNDNRIKIIINEDIKGPSGSRNTGIKYALGEYIAFLDDDDEWLPEKLITQYNLMAEEQSILSFTGKNIFYKSTFQKYSFRNSYPWMLNFYNYVGTTSSVMILKKLIQSADGFDTSLTQLEDYDLFLRLKNKGKFSGIDSSLINYYMDKSFEHVSLPWKNFYKSAIRIWFKQGLIGKILFPIGILITFFQKIKNTID